MLFQNNGMHERVKKHIKKETLAQMLSCEFCEMSKSTFFTEHLWKTASVVYVRATKLQKVKNYWNWNCRMFGTLVLVFLRTPDCFEIGKWEQIWYAHPQKFINSALLIQSLPTVLTKYLGLTLAFMWNSALREKFNFYFPRIFC